jgi:predicted flap endonuclease-1-like 5' DNA nuclease
MAVVDRTGRTFTDACGRKEPAITSDDLTRIFGIGGSLRDRLTLHGIGSLSDLANLTDAEVEELELALRSTRSRVRRGDVARWREEAARLTGGPEMRSDLENDTSALATFVVEARSSGTSGEGGHALAFTVHHIEADETSPALGIGGNLAEWIESRVPTGPALGSPTSEPAEPQASQAPAAKSARRSPRRGGIHLRLIHLYARSTDAAGTSEERSLLTTSPVILHADRPVVLVGHGVLESPEGAAVQCGMRCRLRALDPQAVIERVWGEGTELLPGGQGVEIASPPLSIPAGIYQGDVYLESPDELVKPEALTLPVIMMS